LADHRTPFIFNEWYVAALSEEIGRTMVARTLLDRSILFYRKLDGTPVALRNRCPHRSFPLAKGQLEGDVVACGYHGIQFGPDGRCVAVPSQDSAPPVLVARSYQLVERAPLVWIWMGDPALADPSTIPDHHWLARDDYGSFAGYLHCRSNYIRLHENVLDLTHFPYVHGEATGGTNYIKAEATVRKQDDSISITRRLPGEPVNLAYGRVIGNVGHRVNRTSESWFVTPAFHIAHATIEDLDGGIDGQTDFHFKIIHCFTPETAHSSHYFFCNARNMRVDDAALTAATRESMRSTFLEDDDVLTLVEDIWIQEDSSDYEELSVRGDRASLQMRLIIARRAAAERSHTARPHDPAVAAGTEGQPAS
jgi:vanillate O-demethylase monooxygenase subunit